MTISYSRNPIDALAVTSGYPSLTAGQPTTRIPTCNKSRENIPARIALPWYAQSSPFTADRRRRLRPTHRHRGLGPNPLGYDPRPSPRPLPPRQSRIQSLLDHSHPRHGRDRRPSHARLRQRQTALRSRHPGAPLALLRHSQFSAPRRPPGFRNPPDPPDPKIRRAHPHHHHQKVRRCDPNRHPDLPPLHRHPQPDASAGLPLNWFSPTGLQLNRRPHPGHPVNLRCSSNITSKYGITDRRRKKSLFPNARHRPCAAAGTIDGAAGFPKFRPSS